MYVLCDFTVWYLLGHLISYYIHFYVLYFVMFINVAIIIYQENLIPENMK